MDAKDLVRAMIAQLAAMSHWSITSREDHQYRAGKFDMTVHAAGVAFGYDETKATEFVSEEVQERIAAMD